jgi:protein-S-isoprenylcysteine O-methyltransferase Ste14
MLSIYSWTTLVLWLVAYTGIIAAGRSARRDVRVYGQPPLFHRIFKTVAMIGMFIVIYFPRAFHLHGPKIATGPVHGVIGVTLCAAGLLLLLGSRITLGKNWSDLVLLKQGHQVVQNGPYRFIRHPLYTGLLLALLGSAMTVGTTPAYAITAACFLGLFMKSRQEEDLLTKNLPGYAEYRQRVKGFVPYLF